MAAIAATANFKEFLDKAFPPERLTPAATESQASRLISGSRFKRERPRSRIPSSCLFYLHADLDERSTIVAQSSV
jgi:hypothetical protein